MIESIRNLQGKVAAVTGGAGYIGTAQVLGLARCGVKTAILDIDESKAQQLAESVTKETGTKTIAIQCDVLSAQSIEVADAEIAERLGPLSFLVNGAGGNAPAATTQDERIKPDLSNLEGSFFGIDIDGFRQTMDLNLLGLVLPTHILGQRLMQQESSAIVNISSMNAYRPLTRIPAYSAAKCAVSNFTQWLAVHLAPANVRVNAIAPGFFMTQQLRYLAYQENDELSPRYQRVLDHTPMARFGETEELVDPLLFLLSDASRFITGTIIPVDGGFNAYSGI